MSIATLPIALDRGSIERLCRRHAIHRLSIFGSALRDDFDTRSDIDVLVEFEDGAAPGLRFFGLAAELETLWGRPVDVVSDRGLRGPIGERIRESAVPVYVRN